MTETLAVPKRFGDLYQTLTGNKYMDFNRGENVKIALKEMQMCTEQLVGKYKGTRYENQRLHGLPNKGLTNYGNALSRDEREDLGSLCDDLPQGLQDITVIYDALASIQGDNLLIDYSKMFGPFSRVRTPDEFVDFLIMSVKYIQWEIEIFDGMNHIIKRRLGQQQKDLQPYSYDYQGEFLPPFSR